MSILTSWVELGNTAQLTVMTIVVMVPTWLVVHVMVAGKAIKDFASDKSRTDTAFADVGAMYVVHTLIMLFGMVLTLALSIFTSATNILAFILVAIWILAVLGSTLLVTMLSIWDLIMHVIDELS